MILNSGDTSVACFGSVLANVKRWLTSDADPVHCFYRSNTFRFPLITAQQQRLRSTVLHFYTIGHVPLFSLSFGVFIKD